MKAATKHRIYRLLMAVALAGALSIPAAADQSGPGYSFGDAAGKNESCLTCHADPQQVKGASLINPTLFGHTTHAQIGCTSCHEGVTPTHPGDGTKTTRASCQQCHAEVNNEYATSVHAGKAACSGCHNPHKVESPREISGMEINQMCGGCHDKFKMSAKHGEWLPQADLHLNMLPCITCHTGSKNYFVSMYLVSSKQGKLSKPQVATYEELKDVAGGRHILTLIDTNNDNYISLAELRVFNRNPEHKFLRLQGMMTPETVSHKFEILDDRRNCTFCHGSGPTVMQTSYLSLPEANGTFSRVQVEKGAVLDALYGTPDFYLMGSNKNNVMSWIGLAVICGGLIMPVGHGFMRFLTRKNRMGKEHHS